MFQTTNQILSISPPRHVEATRSPRSLRERRQRRGVRTARRLGAPEAAERFTLQRHISIVIYVIVNIHTGWGPQDS